MTVKARWVGIVAISLIWGSTWLAIKIGLGSMPPFLSAGMRFAIAAGILSALAWTSGVAPPREPRTHAGLLALGFLNFVVNYGAVYWGEQYVSSGLTAVLFATYPLFVLLIAHFSIGAERITARKLAGVALGFAGVAVIFRSDIAVDDARATLAVAVIMLSPVASAMTSVGVKKWGHNIHPYSLTALPMAYGAVALTAIGLATENPRAIEWSAVSIGALLYLALFGSVVAFVVYYRLLKVVPVSLLALVSYAFPIVAMVLGWLILEEAFSGSTLAGAAMVLVGIALATWRRRGAAPAESVGAASGASPTVRRTPT